MQHMWLGFPSQLGSAGKESTRNVGDLGLIPELGRSPEKGKATHSRVLAWRIPWIHGITRSWKRLNNFHFHFECSCIRWK